MYPFSLFFALLDKCRTHSLPCLEYVLFHVKTTLLLSGFFLFLLFNFIDGYVWDVSAVSRSRDRKREYFQFILQVKEEEKSVLSFSPEKHKLLLKIQHKQVVNKKILHKLQEWHHYWRLYQ